METQMYIYKSPYPSPYQIGMIDTSQKQTQENTNNITNTNQVQNEAKTFESSIKQDVKPSVNKLDIYA